MTQAGTTPASGIPRKKRAVRSPGAFLTAAMHMTIIPHVTMTIGKKYFADIFFMRILDGSRPAVTAKYVIETDQLNSVPTSPREFSNDEGVPVPRILTLPLSSVNRSVKWGNYFNSQVCTIKVS
jgi:hypothetical protein